MSPICPTAESKKRFISGRDGELSFSRHADRRGRQDAEFSISRNGSCHSALMMGSRFAANQGRCNHGAPRGRAPDSTIVERRLNPSGRSSDEKSRMTDLSPFLPLPQHAESDAMAGERTFAASASLDGHKLRSGRSVGSPFEHRSRKQF